MSNICLEHLETGMRISKDVKGPNGEVAIQSGQVVDEATIEIIETLGINRIPVDEDDSAVSSDIRLERIESYVAPYFQYVDPDCDAFVELYRLTAEKVWDAVEGGWSIPCQSEFQAKNVEHMRDLFFKGTATVEHLVKHETSLASFPDIYVRIKAVLDSPTSSANDIAKVVSADPGISSKLLKLVNSPFFGLASKVDSVPHAVTLVGVKEVATIALGISTIDYFKDIPEELVNMAQFWSHALSCAVLAKLIAKHLGLPSDRFFTAGLLHDCGRLIMYKNMPYASVQSLLYARGNSVPLVEAEKEILGFDHQDVAKLLLKQWEFPEDLRDLIACHHAPHNTSNALDASVLQLADNIANAAAISRDNMYVLPGMSNEFWKALGISVDELDHMIANHDRDIADITKVFI